MKFILASELGGQVREGESVQAILKLHRVCVILVWTAIVNLASPKVIVIVFL